MHLPTSWPRHVRILLLHNLDLYDTFILIIWSNVGTSDRPNGHGLTSGCVCRNYMEYLHRKECVRSTTRTACLTIRVTLHHRVD